jgi:hypothetical protein
MLRWYEQEMVSVATEVAWGWSFQWVHRRLWSLAGILCLKCISLNDPSPCLKRLLDALYVTAGLGESWFQIQTSRA